jgi:hypothetical protein
MSSTQDGKRKQHESTVKIEVVASAVKAEPTDEGTAPKKARVMHGIIEKELPTAGANASTAPTKAGVKHAAAPTKPMPAIIEKELPTAAATASVETISRWLQTYGSGFINRVDSSHQRRTFLHEVIKNDNLVVLTYLVEKKWVDVNCKIAVGENGFMYGITVAVAHDALKCLTFFYEKGAFTTNVIKGNISLAHQAIQNCALNALKYIATWGSDFLTKRDDCGFTPLDYLSKKQGGNSGFTRACDLTSTGMKCALLLAEHMNEQDAKTARYPFSQLFKGSSVMKMLQEKYFPILYRHYHTISDTLETCMGQGHHDAAVFLIEAGVKFWSKSAIERAYHNALQKRAPDSLLKTIENLLD